MIGLVTLIALLGFVGLVGLWVVVLRLHALEAQVATLQEDLAALFVRLPRPHTAGPDLGSTTVVVTDGTGSCTVVGDRP